MRNCPVAAQLHGANKIMQEVLDVLLFEDWSHYDVRCKIDEGYLRLFSHLSCLLRSCE